MEINRYCNAKIMLCIFHPDRKIKYMFHTCDELEGKEFLRINEQDIRYGIEDYSKLFGKNEFFELSEKSENSSGIRHPNKRSTWEDSQNNEQNIFPTGIILYIIIECIEKREGSTESGKDKNMNVNNLSEEASGRESTRLSSSNRDKLKSKINLTIQIPRVNQDLRHKEHFMVYIGYRIYLGEGDNRGGIA